MLKIGILSDCGVEVSSRGDKADRTSQAELECKIEGSATIGRVSQKLTPLAVTSTECTLHRLSSGVNPAPFNHTLTVFFIIVLPEIHKFPHRATPRLSRRQNSHLHLPLFGHFWSQFGTGLGTYKRGVEKPARARYRACMNDRVPPHDDLDSETETPRVNKVNHLSRKTYLRGTSRFWGLGLLGLASAATLGWIWRTDLAESGVQSLLQQRGIEGGISFTKLSVNEASIRDLRLGPANNPTLLLPTATLSWHVDIGSGRLVIDRLEATGAKLHIGMTKNGEPDFGALKPFLIPSDKPSQVRLADVVLRDALLSFDSPVGRGSARIEASGGDLQGWRAQVLVKPPKDVSAQPNNRPLAFGLALLPGQKTADGQPSPTQIGLALQPDGQSYRWGDLEIDRVRGVAQALVVLDGKGGTRVETRTIAL